MPTNFYTSDRALNGIGVFFDLLVNPDQSAVGEQKQAVVNATSGGSNIQWTQTAGGTVLEWISGRSPAGGWTLSGNMTFQITAQESAMTTNIGARARVYRRTPGGTETEVTGSPFDDGIEFNQGTFGNLTWTGTPGAGLAFAEDDRLVLRYFITGVGGMGTGTGTMRYNCLVGGGTEPIFAINETVVFKSDAANFGDLVGSGWKGNAAITDPMSPPQPITISVGDLIFVAVSEAGANTSVGCTDSLGNSYTELNGGTNGSANIKAFFSVATTGGACTPSVDTTASANSAALGWAVYKGPFAASPLDVNTTSASDSATPYTCNATGTLAQADELIIGYFGGVSAATQEAYDTPTPSGAYIAVNNPALVNNTLSICISDLVVSSTSSVTMAVARSGGTRPTACVTATFKKEVVLDNLLGQAVF